MNWKKKRSKQACDINQGCKIKSQSQNHISIHVRRLRRIIHKRTDGGSKGSSLSKLLYLLLILPLWCIQRLNQGGSMAEEHGVAGGPHNHTDHGEPDVTLALWRVGTVSYAQHVTHGHKQGIWVLYVPRGVLRRRTTRQHWKYTWLQRIISGSQYNLKGK